MPGPYVKYNFECILVCNEQFYIQNVVMIVIGVTLMCYYFQHIHNVAFLHAFDVANLYVHVE